MKRRIWRTLGVQAAVTTVALALTATATYAGPITRREVRQRARIHQGVQSGDLTRGETNVLRREQRGIEHLREHALTDGHIGPRERSALTNAQNRASHAIYRLKHNGREVPPAQ
jgi:hypothetical protein